MSEVVPTINAESTAEFARMIGRVKNFARRIHLDICDGKFADRATIGLSQAYGVEGAEVDIHLMVEDPHVHFENAVSLKPKLVIYHFESTGDLAGIVRQTQDLGVKAGLALLPQTPVEIAAALIEKVDHVLIFTGRLSHNGGEFQDVQLQKVEQVRAIKPGLELSVDGGVNTQNAAKITASGVDILYTGAHIHNAKDPEEAFQNLQAATKEKV